MYSKILDPQENLQMVLIAEFEGVSFTKNFEGISCSEIISRESKVCPDSWLIYELIAILSWGETTKAT